MLYAERNEQGEITAIRTSPVEPGQDQLTDDELVAFLSQSGDIASYQTLLTLMDTRIVRVLDDLIDVLVDKNIIRFTDLPEDARKKIGDRKRIRQKMRDEIQLMVDDIL
ncbi:hypothetical protein [Desulfopila sp. IMCC35008]|uniref:hypothetical protein n=1 Tax=Desulfopila sp. IMCC35008 TaxID=2653858 RepID=UPI0013D508C8|nr:hypothetical protein [Desulfopila sp. IMCC35008]